MLELVISALITLLPDYLYRRYRQGKRLGHEITLFNVWYELRWGITGCVSLAIVLITVIFYFHPTTQVVISIFRSVTLLSDRVGIVEEVYVGNNQVVKAGDPIFRLETSRERAAAETARRQIAELDATLELAQRELDAAEGVVKSAESDLNEAEDALRRREAAFDRNRGVISEEEIERVRSAVEARQGELTTARAQRDLIVARITDLLPAQRASAEAMLAEAQADIRAATVFAGTDGTVKQFALRPGDMVNPILRPAGVLVPAESGGFFAGFQQIAAQVLYVGMIAEITCASMPLTVIQMRITDIQNVISAGQFRPTDQLIDVKQRIRPGTIAVELEPAFESDMRAYDIPQGSRCVAVAYNNHSAAIESGRISGIRALAMSLVDGMGIANAIVIRVQALLLPIRTIVFGG